jgi:hypothetical protein
MKPNLNNPFLRMVLIAASLVWETVPLPSGNVLMAYATPTLTYMIPVEEEGKEGFYAATRLVDRPGKKKPKVTLIKRKAGQPFCDSLAEAKMVCEADFAIIKATLG